MQLRRQEVGQVMALPHCGQPVVLEGLRQLRQHHRRQDGRLRTDDGQRLVPAAVRAVMMRAGIASAVACAFAQVGGHINIRQRDWGLGTVAVRQPASLTCSAPHGVPNQNGTWAASQDGKSSWPAGSSTDTASGSGD